MVFNVIRTEKDENLRWFMEATDEGKAKKKKKKENDMDQWFE